MLGINTERRLLFTLAVIGIAVVLGIAAGVLSLILLPSSFSPLG